MSQGGGVVGAASGVDLGALIRDRFEVLRTRRGLELALGTPGSQWQRSLVSAAEEDDAPVLVPLPPAGGFDEDAEDTATGPRGPGPFPSTKRLGLNNLHDRTYEFDTSSGSVGPQVQYGNDGDPLEDSGRNLGARVVRHIGGLDLLWSSLAPRGTISSNEELLLGASVPASGSTPSLADLVHDRPNPLRGALNADLFAAMLTDAHDAGLKVILTLLTYGGGSSQTSAYAAGSAWELCRDGGDPASALAPPDLDVDGTLAQILKLDWKDDHRGATLDGHPFPTDGTVAGAACDFHEQHLDVSSSYKRSFVAEYARHVGTLLSRVNGLLPVPLSDILEAVELFNEVDTRNYYETDGRRAAAEEAFGAAVRWGDVDGDGTSEVVTGARGGPPRTLGAVRIIDLWESSTVGSSDAWAVLTGTGALTGTYLDLGATDGDGHLDLAVLDNATDTMPNPDGVAVYLHRGPITASGDLADAEATIYQSEGDFYSGHLGASLHASVDLDGDGATELVMGQWDTPHMDESGRAHIFDGSITGLVSEEAAELTLFGERPFSHLGFSLSAGGDVDGDGHPELLVSAPHETTGSHGGKIYLFYGPPDETWSTETPGATIATYEEFAEMGDSVSMDADLDGDGRADIVVGASHSLAYSPEPGAVFLFYEALSGVVMVHPDADAVIFAHDPEASELAT